MKRKYDYIWKLGMFVIIGVIMFMVTVYFIGKNRNLFVETFQLESYFKNVSGLKVGNNVRFSGINVGTVKEIEFVSDSSVVVRVAVKEEVRQYIKTDARATIGSDGLMGDKVFSISPGTASNKVVQNNAKIVSAEAVEMEDLMKGVKVSVDNAAVITDQLAQFTYKMNNGNGALSKLLSDKSFANDVDATMSNIKKASKGLDENMEAAKNNFLLRGYFKKKQKEEEKKQKEAKEAAKEAAEKEKQQLETYYKELEKQEAAKKEANKTEVVDPKKASTP